MFHRWFPVLILASLLLSGCATSGKPGPVGGEFVDNSHPNASTGASVTVLFGTDRVPTAGNITRFTTTQGDLSWGSCEVKIPSQHCRGQIERPNWCQLEFNADPREDFILKGVSIMTTGEFADRLSQGVPGETFLFVHGFNVSFQEAAFNTAQIAYDLRLDRPPFMYSWASKESVAQYMADANTVQNTLPRFKEFLKTVLASRSVRKVHLVAHSMGTRALTETLRMLKEEGGDFKKVGQVFLLAADIDATYFQEQLFGKISDIGEGFTIYSSSKDRALMASASVAGSKPRLGQAGQQLTVMDRMTTVDATYCSDLCTLCHSLASMPCVLNDLFMSINRGLAPTARLMDQKSSPAGRTYYQLYDTNCRD